MVLAYSPVSKSQYKMLNGQKTPKPIRRITGGSSQTNDIYLIPYISEERYQNGYPSTNQKIEWTYDLGNLNDGDIFILDSKWDPKIYRNFRNMHLELAKLRRRTTSRQWMDQGEI